MSALAITPVGPSSVQSIAAPRKIDDGVFASQSLLAFQPQDGKTIPTVGLEPYSPTGAPVGLGHPPAIAQSEGLSGVNPTFPNLEAGSRSLAVTTDDPSSPSAVLRRLAGSMSDQQRNIDGAIALARSGRTFSSAELLALQAHTHRSSFELTLVSKMIEQLSSGAKRVLETQT